MELYELVGERLEYGWLVYDNPYPHVRLGGDGFNPPLSIPLCPPFSKYDFYHSFEDGIDYWLKSARIIYNGNPKFLLYPGGFPEGRMVAVIWYFLPDEGCVRAFIRVRNGLLLHQQSHNGPNGLGTVALLICYEGKVIQGFQYESFASSYQDIPKIVDYVANLDYDGVLTIEPVGLDSSPYFQNATKGVDF